MKEGWCNRDYWSLCEDKEEARRLTSVYGLADYLPGYSIVGLKSWDDFILSDKEGNYFVVPCVPLERTELKPFQFPLEHMKLEADPRLTNKIRWFVKPLKFGGDPRDEANIAWISLDDHAKAIKWWNEFYKNLVAKQRKARK